MRNGPLAALLAAPLACGPDASGPDTTAWQQGPHLRLDLAADPQADFWATPFPGEHRLTGPGGTVSLAGFHDVGDRAFVDAVVSLVDGTEGAFGSTSPVHLVATEELAPFDLDVFESGPGAPVELVVLSGARAGSSWPLQATFEAEATELAPANRLGILPYQGLPLPAEARVAALVRGPLETAAGEALVPPVALQQLVAGEVPEGMDPALAAAWQADLADLEALGVAPEELLGLTVYETADPTAPVRRLVQVAREVPLSEPTVAPTYVEEFDDYCVFEGRLAVPVYQEGTPPFTSEGGDIVVDAEGFPVLQGTEEARFVLTLPKGEAPAAGWPTALFIRTGGGGDRPLVDRGVRDAGGEALEPGTGPALTLARAGWAGISVDGPHGGIRNLTGADEQFLIFNFSNPAAMRGNLLQTAAEAALVPDLLANLEVDAEACEGTAPRATFDTDTLALLGHSMGATVAPLAAAVEPRFDAVVLSGAGGSWIENVLHKQLPLEVLPIAESLVGYEPGELSAFDPFLGLLQWGGERADPPVFGATVRENPGGDARHLLMVQGIVDRYILPPIANSTSLSHGLDLAGPALDADHPELSEHLPLEELLWLTGAEARSLPAGGDQQAPDGSPVTAVVVQHAEDGVEDGHEVFFQLEAPKHQLRCFLEDLAAGEAPVLPEGGAATDPCP